LVVDFHGHILVRAAGGAREFACEVLRGRACDGRLCDALPPGFIVE
jgi:hypothetical protein